MKTVVSVQEISEFDIKPRAPVDRWRTLVEDEIGQRWKDRSGWSRIVWPTCKPSDEIPAFDRYGVSYVECTGCGSLYAESRPTEADLRAWYRDSKPAVFWREEILPASESARLEKILRPRADWILDGIAEYQPSAGRAIDISPHSRAMLDLLVTGEGSLEEVVAAGVTADLEGKSARRVKVQPTLLGELPGLGEAHAIIAMDVLNRAADPGALLENLEKTLAPEGLVFATATVASGFELQTLWDRSPTVIPPDKLNLPTIKAIRTMFAEPTWEILELSTPGMFDVELVRQVIEQEGERSWPRVVRALVQRTDASGRIALIELLQSLRLTSFARLVVRKRR